MYDIYDNSNNIVRGGFSSWKKAYDFKVINSRLDWIIKKR